MQYYSQDLRWVPRLVCRMRQQHTFVSPSSAGQRGTQSTHYRVFAAVTFINHPITPRVRGMYIHIATQHVAQIESKNKNYEVVQ